MVIMFNVDSFVNEPDVQTNGTWAREDKDFKFSDFTNEELLRFKNLFWNIEPRGYENLIFKLSQFSSSDINELELVPPVILPDDATRFENFVIDLCSNEQLIVSANLYKGNWDCPLAIIKGCNDKRILVLSNKALNKINSYMNRYNVRAKMFG